MANLELVIKIDEKKYKWLKENNPKADKNSFVGAIVYGIPLPEGDFIAVCKSDFPLTEEVKNELKDTVFISDEPRYCFEMTKIKELMNKATLTTVIPQESILDKIRAEIQDIAFDWQEIDGEHESFMVVDLNDALNIIDKYKAKSEE